MGAADVSSGQPTDDLNNVDATKKQFARKVTADGYNLELSVAWEAIVGATETVDVGTGNVFGLGIGIHDNDVDHREASLQWAAVMLDAMWNTPAYLGTVKFLEGNKLQFIPTNNITGETNEIPYDGSDYERTGIDDIATIPQEFGLYQNYPNPFNPATQITYTIPEKGMVKLAVFDMLGKQVAVLVEEIKQPGFYTVEFDASHLSSGIYFYKLQAGMKSGTHKMLLVK